MGRFNIDHNKQYSLYFAFGNALKYQFVVQFKRTIRKVRYYKLFRLCEELTTNCYSFPSSNILKIKTIAMCYMQLDINKNPSKTLHCEVFEGLF